MERTIDCKFDYQYQEMVIFLRYKISKFQNGSFFICPQIVQLFTTIKLLYENIDAIDEEWGDVEFGEEDEFPVKFEGEKEFVDLSNNRELF